MSGSTLEKSTQIITALYRNIRAQFNYRSGEIFEFFQYRTRGGALVPLALKSGLGVMGFINIVGHAPSLSEKRSAESFIRKYPKGKILFVSEQCKEALAITTNQMILPIFALV